MALGATIPLGGLTEGSDVAVAVHLTSDETSFAVGVVLPVDGSRMVAWDEPPRLQQCLPDRVAAELRRSAGVVCRCP